MIYHMYIKNEERRERNLPIRTSSSPNHCQSNKENTASFKDAYDPNALITITVPETPPPTPPAMRASYLLI